ncbi:hypothetical protein PoB_006542200 [Plakobranchus ocellatus]|uniref:Uncharacterized protein n=1 Tax=Plakobranchus ocellatus TaxID=259542 RepID=A0AAV4D418_9GAST|nr:hypothetical protein PoB_006542200 [Plakobranchus ocellatus]
MMALFLRAFHYGSKPWTTSRDVIHEARAPLKESSISYIIMLPQHIFQYGSEMWTTTCGSNTISSMPVNSHTFRTSPGRTKYLTVTEHAPGHSWDSRYGTGSFSCKFSQGR